MMWTRLGHALFVAAAMALPAQELQSRETFVLDRAQGNKAAEMQFYHSVQLVTREKWRGEVDLFGIGRVFLRRPEFIEQVSHLAPKKGSAHFLVRLGFTARDGRASACEALDTNHTASQNAGQQVCDAIMSVNANLVRTRRGFDWGAEKGFLTLDIGLYRAPVILRPFAQELGRKGIPVEVRIPYASPRSKGSPSCSVLDQRVAWDEQQPICDIYARQLELSAGKASDGELLEKWQRGQIYLRQTADRSQYRVMVSHRVIGPAGFNRPIYDPLELDPAEELTEEQGELRFRRDRIRYPERAKKTDVTGRTMILLRFKRQDLRRPSLCRVLQSSGSSVLDNASCDNALRRAKWLWKGPVEARTEGWIKVPIAWALNGRIGREILPGFERGKPVND